MKGVVTREWGVVTRRGVVHSSLERETHSHLFPYKGVLHKSLSPGYISSGYLIRKTLQPWWSPGLQSILDSYDSCNTILRMH